MKKLIVMKKKNNLKKKNWKIKKWMKKMINKQVII